ncbi:hypothetical protein B9Q13_00660 [Candidatus Marsarchaeota G2 archaeon ECH_B_SAG-G16]|jgi:Uncharacterized ACR, COG1753.|uniref:Putative antitoxin B9Q00_10555 n=2 Tax=Candidatus Marsarchaeota TaxID=1978152 RepID=A0A2R6AIF9_9ARCH|nr:MAG: hypothetical protein B9Q00_10555 [Candidatus Marsarchaeota G1 archaeon OSP_C]PSO05813.1 MAG: hypothetical protein B9Q13_00660 [Candidatus Marsarchaeota G2 archaeon ECH_B_SAG-G16]
MVRVISISDDVYEKLVRIKGDKSFSEVLKELLRGQGKKYEDKNALDEIFGVLSHEEAVELEREINLRRKVPPRSIR